MHGREQMHAGFGRKTWTLRPKWEDNIKMHVKGVWLEGVDMIHLAQDRDRWQGCVDKVMNIKGYFLSFSEL